MTRIAWLLWASTLVGVAVPLAWGLLGAWRARPPGAGVPAAARPWRAMLGSMLLYVLAFNLTFFVQEVFLVLPKAMTPGLSPTLFHNNHRWEGEHPLAALFQGAGALATAAMGLACLWAARRGAGRTPTRRLLLVWLAFCGLLMALPQVVIGALSGGSDVGMAMDYLQLSAATKTILAVLALVAIPCVALALLPPALALADDAGTPRARVRHIGWWIALPALLAMMAVLPYRVPREWLEVVLLPVLVTVPGVLWMLAGAARAGVGAPDVRGRIPLAALFAAALVLLVFFQGVLRPGVPFY